MGHFPIGCAGKGRAGAGFICPFFIVTVVTMFRFARLFIWKAKPMIAIQHRAIGRGQMKDKKQAYDLYFNQDHVDEQTMMKIAKSFTLLKG